MTEYDDHCIQYYAITLNVQNNQRQNDKVQVYSALAKNIYMHLFKLFIDHIDIHINTYYIEI